VTNVLGSGETEPMGGIEPAAGERSGIIAPRSSLPDSQIINAKKENYMQTTIELIAANSYA
jgi:hypothetical protein